MVSLSLTWKHMAEAESHSKISVIWMTWIRKKTMTDADTANVIDTLSVGDDGIFLIA